jgi:hypothetical protein
MSIFSVNPETLIANIHVTLKFVLSEAAVPPLHPQVLRTFYMEEHNLEQL